MYFWEMSIQNNKLIEEIQSVLDEIPLDLRAEVLVNDLIVRGISVNDLFVKPVGLFRRRFDKDIHSVEQVDLKDGQSAQMLHLNREGLYDGLPENLFHYPPNNKPNAFKEVSRMVEEVKLRALEEENARNFFFAFETEFFRQRLTNEWQERRLFDTITFSMDDEEMLSYLNLPAQLSKRQKGIMFYLYPIIYRIRADLKLMSAAYSVILREDIEVVKELCQAPPPENSSSVNPGLGHINLSTTFTIGHSSAELFECYRFYVRPEDTSRIVLYVPEGRHRQIIEELHRYFVPLHVESDLVIQVPSHEWLMKKENPNESRLGFGMVL